MALSIKQGRVIAELVRDYASRQQRIDKRYVEWSTAWNDADTRGTDVEVTAFDNYRRAMRSLKRTAAALQLVGVDMDVMYHDLTPSQREAYHLATAAGAAQHEAQTA